MIGLNDLPQSVLSIISGSLKAQDNLSFSTAILGGGFPLIIKPVTDYQHRGKYISLNTIATLPIVQSKQFLCTVEDLIAIKYQQKRKCYSSPMSYNDLTLITCPNKKIVMRADVLTKVLH